MPVNMDPQKRRKPADAEPPAQADDPTKPRAFGEDTPEDKEKALADAEWKNLWDATEVINMDEF